MLPGDGPEAFGGRCVDSGPAGIDSYDDVGTVFAVQSSESDDAESVPPEKETVFCTGQVVDGYAAVYMEERPAASSDETGYVDLVPLFVQCIGNQGGHPFGASLFVNALNGEEYSHYSRNAST